MSDALRRPSPLPDLWVCHLGTVPYLEAVAIQERIRERRQKEELPDMLLLLEHPPVYTRGRRSGAEDLPFGEAFYRARSIDVVATDRGGQLTYHGPGQLVGYPIMRIDDVHRFLRTMEHAIVAALAGAGLAARSRHEEGVDYTGVWVDDRKIASIGLHVTRGVTTHGFAINVENDLEPFSWVVACGLPGVTMTSLERESAGSRGAVSLGEHRPVSVGEHPPIAVGDQRTVSARSLACFRRRIAHSFCQAHGRRQRLVSPQRLGLATANAARLAATRAPINPTPPAAVEAVPA